MNLYETSEIRELTTAELNEVSGGITPLPGFVVGGLIAIFGSMAIAEIVYDVPNLWDQVEAYANSQR